MITLISFFVVLLGAFNWFSIGLMQYDFVAGIFGTQSSFLSRAIYIVVGFAGIWMVIMAFAQKGRIKINDNGFKRNFSKAEKHPKHAVVVEADKEYGHTENSQNRLDYQNQDHNNSFSNNHHDKSPFE